MGRYRKVKCAYWEGELAEANHGDADCHTVAFYLMTCPASNQIGCYRLSIAQLCDETGIGYRRASEALRKLSERAFVVVDERFRMVLVLEAARHEYGETPNLADNRTKGLVKVLPELMSVGRKSLVWQHFMARYAEPWADIFAQLPEEIWASIPKPSGSPPEALLKGSSRARQDQDQDQDQDQESPPSPPLGETTPRLAPPGDGKKKGRRIPAVKIPEELIAVGIDRAAFEKRVRACSKTKPAEAWQTELDRLVPLVAEVGGEVVCETYEDATGSGWQGCTPKMVRERQNRRKGRKPRGKHADRLFGG